MWPALKNFLHAFFFDEKAFLNMGSKAIAKLRAAIAIAGLYSVVEADKIAGFLTIPEHAHKVQLAGVIIAGASQMLRAGDQTAKALANDPVAQGTVTAIAQESAK